MLLSSWPGCGWQLNVKCDLMNAGTPLVSGKNIAVKHNVSTFSYQSFTCCASSIVLKGLSVTYTFKENTFSKICRGKNKDVFLSSAWKVDILERRGFHRKTHTQTHQSSISQFPSMQRLAFWTVPVLLDPNTRWGLWEAVAMETKTVLPLSGCTSMTNDFLWVNHTPALHLILTGYVSLGMPLVSHISHSSCGSHICVSLCVYFHKLSEAFVLWDYTPVLCLDVRFPSGHLQQTQFSPVWDGTGVNHCLSPPWRPSPLSCSTSHLSRNRPCAWIRTPAQSLSSKPSQLDLLTESIGIGSRVKNVT